MSDVKIFHNPRCSKSRQTLALLEEKGVDAEVVEYLNTPPSEVEIREILSMLGCGPQDLARKKETVYADLGLADASDDELIRAMVENPILIERPIVIKNGKAEIGRPPEQVLDIL